MTIKTSDVIKTLKNEPFKDTLGGEAETDLTVGRALSHVLTYHKAEGRMKLSILATKFYNDKAVDVDSADLALIKEAVKKTEVYANNVLLGRLELVLDEVKEKKEEKAS